MLIPHEQPTDTAAPAQYRVMYTRGDELLTPAQYRSSFERSLERSLSTRLEVGDDMLARLFAASATAYACAEYRAKTTASIALAAYNRRHERVDGSPLSYFQQVGGPIIYRVVLSQLLWGRAYLRKRYNEHGFPSALEWLNPTDVREIIDYSTGIVQYYDVTPMGAPSQREQVRTEDIIYLPLFDTDSAGIGLSKFEVAFRKISLESSFATYAAAFFVNSARPDGMLTFDAPLQPTEYEDAKENWRQFKGASNAHRTAVMPAGARWTPIQSVPADLAMTELKQEERRDIAAVFEVNLALVGLADVSDPLSANSTYSAIEVNHLRSVTLPHMRLFVLPTLNAQWAKADFVPRGEWSLDVEENSIPALAEANLTRAETAISLTQTALLDYPESRDLLGYSARPDYLKRDPAQALSLWQAGGITRNELRRFAGTDGEDGRYNDPNGDVVLIGGLLLPVDRLAEIAAANVDKAKAPPIAFPPALDAPRLPAQTEPAATVNVYSQNEDRLPIVRMVRSDTGGAYAILTLETTDALLDVQRAAGEALVDAAPGAVTEVTPADQMHITLLYCEQMAENHIEALVADLPAELLRRRPLRLGPVEGFENDDSTAVYLTVQADDALRLLQRQLYERAVDLNLSISEHSAPDQWRPHVTLFYAKAGTPAPTITASIEVMPAALELSRPTYITLTSTPLRSARGPLELAVSFADHQFVREARRLLSEHLTSQGVRVSEWVEPADWRLTLMAASDWRMNDAAALLRGLDLDGVRKVDLAAQGFTRAGADLYLRVNADGLLGLVKALRLDVEAAGLAAAGGVEGIKLCTIEGEAEIGALDEVHYPLVCTNVCMMLAGDEHHRWALRGTSAAQTKELKNWERVIRSKGADYDFGVDALAGTPAAAWVQEALAAQVEVDDVFEIAGLVLRGELVLRAYPETRDQFISEMKAHIGAAVASETDRRNFAARVRVSLRRLGLQAFRDGMNEEGYNPESFGPEELAAFRRWQEESSRFVSDFGAEIFKEAGLSETAVDVRAEMWADKSLREIFNLGRVFGAPNAPKRWVRNPEKDSCTDCIARDGQVLTLAEWQKIGLPGSSQLECHGYHCGCVLEKVES